MNLISSVKVYQKRFGRFPIDIKWIRVQFSLLKSISREKRKLGYRDNNYFDCNGGIILYVIWNINLWVQNIAKYLFEMERIDVRIEHVLEFSIKIVLSVLKIGSEPDSVTFPVGFSPELLSTEIFQSSWVMTLTES